MDFIGGLVSLTKIEEKELSDFFKSQKLAKKKSVKGQSEIIIRSTAIT